MDAPIVVGIALVAFLLLLRRFAARRVAARQGRFVWLMFVPALLGAVVIVWAAIRALMTGDPLLGIPMGIGGTIYVAVLVRFLARLSRAASSAGPREEIEAASSEIFIDHIQSMIGILLIGSLVALVGLIVWAVTKAAH